MRQSPDGEKMCFTVNYNENYNTKSADQAK